MQWLKINRSGCTNECTLANRLRTRRQSGNPNKKKHSPNIDHVAWDKDKLHHTLTNWPDSVKINWTQVAREHGISAKNGGQVVKEFAKERGIDTENLDNTKERVRMRAKKLKMPQNCRSYKRRLGKHD